jgi:hypothetical protein
MTKPNSYPNLEATLGITEPLASTDDGSFLNEGQKKQIDDQLKASAADVSAANDAKATAEAAVVTEKATAKTASDAAAVTATAATTQLRAAATLAGVEGLAEDATPEAINTALVAQINVLNKKPGAGHTGSAAKDEDPSPHAYVDFNNSIYSQIKK